ncbi:MAG: oligosaccharide flippase family protein [Candidatus Omnitrophica bacterium]|nr:oligosaccharide flippase family protein [Candidatus Omnitrophota bacterium]
MRQTLKIRDAFTKNVFIVFAGTSVVNLINLVYQLLIAHSLSASMFAAFNSLLSLYMIFSSPLGILQLVMTKYTSEFFAHRQIGKVRALFSAFAKRALILSMVTLGIFLAASPRILVSLKIPSAASGPIFALLLASSWLAPLLTGTIQGIERFKCYSSVSVLGGLLKIALSFLFIRLGYSIAGALGALFAANLAVMIIFYWSLRDVLHAPYQKEIIPYKEMAAFAVPVAVSYFCFMVLVSFDMVLVKYFFSAHESGLYSISQMLGKIFLFLPGAVSMVLFPRTSGLNAQNQDTLATLKKSLFFVLCLCLSAVVFYNLFPDFVLKILTGKVYPESVLLGRLFSISMSFFALTYVLLSYLLSIRKAAFVPYLAAIALLQSAAIFLWHRNLLQVQLIICGCAAVLFVVHLWFAFRK